MPMFPLNLTLDTITRYMAEHDRLVALDLPKPAYRGQLIGLRMRYGMSFADVNISVSGL